MHRISIPVKLDWPFIDILPIHTIALSRLVRGKKKLSVYLFLAFADVVRMVHTLDVSPSFT